VVVCSSRSSWRWHNNSGSTPDDEKKRRLGGYLMFCGMASLAITSALWFTATSGNPVGAGLAAEKGLDRSISPRGWSPLLYPVWW
jgi:di/tricarboxylate transporter